MTRGRPGTGVEPLHGSIRVRYTVRGQRYGETLRMPPTAANIRKAERVMQRVHREIALGTFSRQDYFPKPVEDAERRFSEYADAWLASLVAASSTRQGYRSALDRIWKPALGSTCLADIRPSAIRAIIQQRSQRVSARTVNNELIPLRAVFEAAIADGILYRTPTVPIHNVRPKRCIPNPFTRSEMEVLLDYLRGHYPSDVGDWFEFAFGTGLRPSEQAALQWADVNWGLRVVRVERALVRGELKGTKTEQVRAVDLVDRIWDILVRRHEVFGTPKPFSPIFRNPKTGRGWSDGAAQRNLYLNKAMAALGIYGHVAYNTRHTYASLALSGGVNVAYLARQLGHSNAGMLLKHYGRWIEDGEAVRQSKKLSEVFGQPAGRNPASGCDWPISRERFALQPNLATKNDLQSVGYNDDLSTPMRKSQNNQVISIVCLVTPTGLEPVFSP